MFTGLIEALGQIHLICEEADLRDICIETKGFLGGVSEGDSIAVNGVCLTVTHLQGDCFYVQAVAETCAVTTLGVLVVGDWVNLEKAMRLGDRLDGHLVSGHVDFVASVLDVVPVDGRYDLTISYDAKWDASFVPKGSVALDGVSLTVVDVLPGALRVTIIPHTLEKTTLGYRKKGDLLNVEVDLLGKYVTRYLSCYAP